MAEKHALLETAKDALELIGVIEIPSPEEPDGVDRLVFISSGGDAGWGLVPTESVPAENTDTVLAGVDSAWEDDWLPISEHLAGLLVEKHLEAWLLERGWQVQVSLRKTGDQQWRLADCLSFADGGGDRLETDYPIGSDKLAVLVDAVLAVSRFTFARRGAI